MLDKLKFKTLDWTGEGLRILDQSRLPDKVIYIDCTKLEDVVSAIKSLKVRGAPAIGIAAAFGVVIGMSEQKIPSRHVFKQRLDYVISALASTRPTAVNLFWALERMRKVAQKFKEVNPEQVVQLLLEEALTIHEEDKRMCERIGEFGATLLKDGDTVLTHCNAGALATGGIGTALGIIYVATWQGKKINVFADETRPVLQGARLTVWELTQQGIDVTLICDNMAAFVMKKRKIDCIIVGADRIASNGDVANKIGTYNVAILANFHKIPFYVAAPSSSFDPALSKGDDIIIEERGCEEVTGCFGSKIIPSGVKVYSPAFDITPAELVTAYITEKGVQGSKVKV